MQKLTTNKSFADIHLQMKLFAVAFEIYKQLLNAPGHLH